MKHSAHRITKLELLGQQASCTLRQARILMYARFTTSHHIAAAKPQNTGCRVVTTCSWKNVTFYTGESASGCSALSGLEHSSLL
jgi:hypothetical protein